MGGGEGGWVIFYKASLCVLQLEGKLYNNYGGGGEGRQQLILISLKNLPKVKRNRA